MNPALFADWLQMIFCTPWALPELFCIMEAWKEVFPYDEK